VYKRNAKFANRTNSSVWETLAQLRKVTRISDFFKEYAGEQAWNAIGNRLQGLCYLSRDDHGWKIMFRKQRPVIGKYFFVNRNIKLWTNYLHRRKAFPL
jgi:hypothetical protein